MFSNDRNSYRSAFVEVWRKSLNDQPLEPLEAQIAEVVRMHPEYHRYLDNGADRLSQDFSPQAGQPNPFLHMGMHIAILEQLSLNRPLGIRARYQQLIATLGDAHQAEHRIMDCLGEALWTLQQRGGDFDEAGYLSCIDRMLRKR